MAKYLRFVLIFLLISISITNPQLGQSGFVTFFGPVEFVRGTGKPFIEAKDFSAEGFQAPFTLHLRNGDENGSNRVSSAHVWLNDGLLFGPSDFSQKVGGYDIDVDLMKQNKLEVKIAGIPGSKLKIWIEGVPTDFFQFEDVTINPDGGIHYLASGIVLDVPPGAVNESFTFSIRRLRPEEVQSILDSYGLEKYFLAGFEVGSNSIVFNEPITMSLPSEPLESAADLPFHYEANPLQQLHSLAGPDSYLNSLISITSRADCQGKLYLETDPETGATVSLCIPKIDPSKEDVIAAIKDVIEDNAGVSCEVPNPPCFCTNVEVIEDSRNYIVDKECEYYEVTGRAIYHDCAGVVNSWTFIEDKRPAIITDPPVAEGDIFIIEVGEFQTFRYWLEDKLGNEVPSQILGAKTDDPNGVLEILQDNPKEITLEGKTCGNAKLVINAGCENTKTIDINVGNVKEVKIDPPQKTTLELCETLQLSAKVYDQNGQQKEGFPVEWSYTSLDTVWVDLNPETGYLEANGAGEITVYAETCFETDEIHLTINPLVDLQPDNLEVKVGETVPLLVRVEEKCGEALENPELLWTIPEEVVSVDISDPSNYSVTGISPGTTTLTVTFKGISDSIKITVASAPGVEKYKLIWRIYTPDSSWEWQGSPNGGHKYRKTAISDAWFEGYVIFEIGPEFSPIIDQSWSASYHATDYFEELDIYDTYGFYYFERTQEFILTEVNVQSLRVDGFELLPDEPKKIGIIYFAFSNECPGLHPAPEGHITQTTHVYTYGAEEPPNHWYDTREECLRFDNFNYYKPGESQIPVTLEQILPDIIPLEGTEVVKETVIEACVLPNGPFPSFRFYDGQFMTWIGSAKIMKLE